MKKKFKLGVIGAGFMSTAIVNGAISSKSVKNKDIIVSDINEDSLQRMRNIGVTTTNNNCDLLNQSEFVLFAIKPQSLNDVLNEIKDCDTPKFLSIMAGIKKDKIKKFFPDAMVARCMPNTPCSIGYGSVGLDVSDYKEETDRQFIINLLSSFATVVLVDEKMLNTVTGISGSSPAYFYLFLKGIIDSGVKNGLSYDDAKILATNAMIGAGEMVLKNKDKSIDELINAVCSKKGTTIEAVDIYKKSDLGEITSKAVDACIKRAYELENL